MYITNGTLNKADGRQEAPADVPGHHDAAPWHHRRLQRATYTRPPFYW